SAAGWNSRFCSGVLWLTSSMFAVKDTATAPSTLRATRSQQGSRRRRLKIQPEPSRGNAVATSPDAIAKEREPMKRIVLAAIVIAMPAMLAVAQPANDPYVPGLGEFMTATQLRHAKLWFAGKNSNWALAAYEVDEIKEGLED